MTRKLTITDDKLSALLSEVEKSFTGCLGHSHTDTAEEYADMISALRELQERRKAERDSEPVFFIEVEGDDWINAGRIPGSTLDFNDLPDGVNKLYASPQPAPEREQVRREHAEWSQATFGNVGPTGLLKHLGKEALEAAAEPADLSEWADMQFLLWDAQRRAGITDEQITQAMIEKLAVNKLRDWPEPKDGEPRLHNRLSL